MAKEPIPRPLPAKARLHLALEENANLRTRIAALEAKLAAHTGGVKVKPLEWEEIHQRRSDEDPTTEVVGYEAGIPGLWWHINVEASDFSLASPEYSYQTFGTLEAAKAAAQADFERRILAALEPAAPEGQQPVAWGVFYRGKIVAFSLHKSPHYSVPLYTSPTEQTVTKAMVEAVVQAVRPYTMQTLFIDEHRELVRDALKAAMEAGR